MYASDFTACKSMLRALVQAPALLLLVMASFLMLLAVRQVEQTV